MSSLVVPMLQVILIFPALKSLGSKYPALVMEKKNLSLKRPRIFLINFVGYIISIVGNCKMVFEGYENKASLASFSVIIFIVLFFLTMLSSSFLIGTSLEMFCQTIEHSKVSGTISTGVISDLCSDFQQLKAGLSLLLFLTFSLKCVLVINLALGLAVPSSFTVTQNVICLLLLISNCLDLFYITIAVEETLGIFKSLNLQLR